MQKKELDEIVNLTIKYCDTLEDFEKVKNAINVLIQIKSFEIQYMKEKKESE